MCFLVPGLKLVVIIFSSSAEWKIKLNMNQINIDHMIILKHWFIITLKNNDGQGGNFSFTPSQKEICPLSSQKFNEVDHNLNFILSHFQEPIFPRNIMTKALGYQKEVFNGQEALEYFSASNYEDCRINTVFRGFVKPGVMTRTTAARAWTKTRVMMSVNNRPDRSNRSQTKIMLNSLAISRTIMGW